MQILTDLYMQNEFANFGKTKISKIKFTEDFKTMKEVPEYRRPVTSGPSKQVLMPNHAELDFFYAEEETNEKVWKADAGLNAAYRLLQFGAVAFLTYAAYRHFHQQARMYKFANLVSERIDKKGG